MMNVFDEIKDALDTKTFKKIGRRGTGCISSGEAYETDNGLVFIKTNDGKEAMLMFLGELESLKALERTNTIRVPKPYIAIPDPQSEGGAIVMEYFDMQQLTNHTVLGEKLAQLHLHNSNLGKVKGKKESWVAGKRGASSSNDNETLEFVDKFGFEITTCCGYFPMTNDWLDNWVDFFARNRLEVQIRLIEEKCGDREALELWSHLQLRIPSFFKTLQEPIIPALLHGDLWSGNVSQVENELVIYDPASFYGHSEFELSISMLFGGFNRAFYERYHQLVKKTPGFDERIRLYQVFHYLNHWNHFGGGYREQSLRLMRSICK